MNRLNADFLNDLAADRQAVKPLRNGPSVGMLSFGVLAGLAAVGLVLGPRVDLMAGAPSTMFLFRTGMLVLLSGISALAALDMARPNVGAPSRVWEGALALACLVPATALVMALLDPAAAAAAVLQPSAVLCLGVSLAAALAFGAVMVVHLRRGAPVTLERAGTLVGLASGSLGVLVYSLHCPSNSVIYIGAWYGLAIAISTIMARRLVPALIRW